MHAILLFLQQYSRQWFCRESTAVSAILRAIPQINLSLPKVARNSLTSLIHVPFTANNTRSVNVTRPSKSRIHPSLECRLYPPPPPPCKMPAVPLLIVSRADENAETSKPHDATVPRLVCSFVCFCPLC